MRFLVIAAAAVVVYERYDSQILNFWRNLGLAIKALIP
jgi:hypothetical protein